MQRTARILPLLAVMLIACESTSDPEIVDTIELTPTQVELNALGATHQLAAVVLTESGDEIEGADVSWSTSNGSIATVTSSGVVTAVANGSAQVVAELGGVSASTTVVVEQVVHWVTFNADSMALNYVGAVRTLRAAAHDSLGRAIVDAVLGWSSTAPDTVSVSDGVVTAHLVGSARVIAQAANGLADTIFLRARQVAAGVLVTPSADSVQAGQTIQLTASVRDSANIAMPGAPVSWISGLPGIATVSVADPGTSQVATVSGVSGGSSLITAISGIAHGNVMVRVHMVPAASLSLSPDSAVGFIGVGPRFDATLRDGAGNILSPTGRTITWRSSNSGVATVGEILNASSAVAIGVSPGTALIIATSDGRADTVRIRVSAPCPTNVIAVGETHAGSLATSDCAELGAHYYDVWTLSVPAGGAVLRLGVTATAFDAVVYELGDYGDTVYIGRDPGPGTHARTDQLLSPGNHTIVVSSATSALGSYSLSIGPIPIASVSLAPDSVVVPFGSYTPFLVTVRDTDGTVIDPNLVLTTNTSTDTSIVTVNELARAPMYVRGMAPGTANVVASIGGHADTVQVRVVEACGGGTVTVGDSVTGALSSSDCAHLGDYYEIWTLSPAVSGTVVIELSSTAFNTLLLVYDDYMDLIDDDSGPGTNSRLEVGVSVGWGLSIYVKSSPAGGTGAYTLSVTPKP